MSHNIKIEENNTIVNISEIKEETIVTVVDDTTIGVVTIGVQGPQGASSTLIEIASQEHYFPDGYPALTCFQPDLSVCTNMSNGPFYGITVLEIEANTVARLYTMGDIETPGKTWIVGSPIFVNEYGVITQERPTGYLHRIGYALASNRIMLTPGIPSIRQYVQVEMEKRPLVIGDNGQLEEIRDSDPIYFATERLGNNVVYIERKYTLSLAEISPDTTRTEIPSLSFDPTQHSGLNANYILKRGSSSVRMGTILVASDGVDSSISFYDTEIGHCGVEFSVGVEDGLVKVFWESDNTANDVNARFESTLYKL